MMSDEELRGKALLARTMFSEAFDAYMRHGFPHDELRPLSCTPSDGYGHYALTLVDALDSVLVVADDASQFERAVELLTASSSSVRFDVNANVSVFETNIRVLGGLLSAYLLAEERGLALVHLPRLLELAKDVGDRLLPAFETPTGLPYGTVNLRSGVPPGETTITSTAGATTFMLEFGVLSKLTGDERYAKAAKRAMLEMWNRRSAIGLLGNHIDTKTGTWIALDSSVGSATDSFYEYLLKAAIFFDDPDLQEIWAGAYETALEKLRVQGKWYLEVNMNSGLITAPVFDSLAAFWPGLQALNGDVLKAGETAEAFWRIWKSYGALPERLDLHTGNLIRRNYPLRPELIESLFVLSCAHPDRDKLVFQHMGASIIESLHHYCKAPCGYAALADVKSHAKEDMMDSFFLAETTKYLHLLFNLSHWVRSGRYMLTTEAHVFPIQRRF
jgi:mannosidase alpha-like ER degradation enhancer 2